LHNRELAEASMVEHIVGMNIEQNKAVLERVFWHVVGIVNMIRRTGKNTSGQDIAWQEIGTGVACRFMERKLILTAKHVLEHAGDDDLRFLPRPSGRIEWADEPIRTRVERVPFPIGRIVRCQWEDLAAIVLKPEPTEIANVRFCDLPKNFGQVPTEGVLLVIGYPYDQAFIAQISQNEGSKVHNLSAKSDGFRSEVVKTNKLLSGFDEESHFLIKFYPSFEGERPDGYSGAGVWDEEHKETEETVWSATPKLTGIQTHAYRESGLLRVVKAEVMLKFLEESVGAGKPPGAI